MMRAKEIMTPERMKAICAAELERRGWKLIPHEMWHLQKEIATAVGPKWTTIRHLTVEGSKKFFALQGEYWSEGRNILEPSDRWIPFDADDALVEKMAREFIQQVEVKIGDSYAVRVLRSIEATKEGDHEVAEGESAPRPGM